MFKQTADLEFVKRLLQRWDPIGVIETLVEDGLPPYEYDSYAPEILEKLQAKVTEEQLTEYLGWLQSKKMGFGPSPEKDRAVARELVNWWSQNCK